MPTAANPQPSAAIYFKRLDDREHRAAVLEVLRVTDGSIAEITAFLLLELFPRFSMPSTL